MDWITIMLGAGFMTLLGWCVHRIRGMHGSALHWLFVGGCGVGICTLVEKITGFYAKSFIGVIAMALACTFLAEYLTQLLKRKLDSKHHIETIEEDLNE